MPPSLPQQHLDVFANPAPERDYVIEFVIPEFTCVCPLTGQPDFAHFTVDMIADKLCIELKSLKLYLWSYRDHGAFHEKVTNAILDDLVAATKPRFARIRARWNVRGGIYTNVVAEHRRRAGSPRRWSRCPRLDETPSDAPADLGKSAARASRHAAATRSLRPAPYNASASPGRP